MDGVVVRSGIERKYLVPEDDAESFLGLVRHLLAPDPFAGPTGTYTVSSLYLDTPDQASYRRELTGKWRLRRYGDSDAVFAEYKAKPEPGRVHKRRSAISPNDCMQLPYIGCATWFVRAIHKNSLHPTCMISYERSAYVGTIHGEEIRLTLDQNIRAAVQCDYIVPRPVHSGIRLTEYRILEVKFESELPTPLERVLGAFGLMPESFSKYRAAIDRLAR